MKTGDQVVQDLPWKMRVQGKIFIVGGLGYMFDAWDVSLNGFLTPLVGLDFGLSSADRGWVATANLIGMAVGAIVFGSIADRMGRKKSFTVTLLIFAIFSLVGAFSPNYGIFLILRFLAGFGLGGCIPVDYALVGEFSPRRIRGRVLTLLDLFWPIGATLAGVASLAVLDVPGNWRLMLGMMVLPALLIFFIRRGVPESPIYLARVGREAEAREVIDDLVRRTGATPEPYYIASQQHAPESEGALKTAVTQFASLWTRLRKITVVSWSLFISIMVLYYSALSWMPTLLRDAGMTQHASFVGSTLMNLAGIFGAILSAILVDKLGRKVILGIAAPLSGFSLVAFGFSINNTTVAMVLLCVFGFFILATIPVLYAYVAELYPTQIRATGFAWASSMSRTATGLAPILFSAVLWPILGLPTTFALLTVLVIGSIALMAVWGPETKGRELDADDDKRDPVVAVQANSL